MTSIDHKPSQCMRKFSDINQNQDERESTGNSEFSLLSASNQPLYI